MQIICQWQEGQYPSFNLELASREGVDPFIKIRGCKIMSGKNGEFVSYPSRKLDSGKYWNHVYGSDAFNAAVLAEAKKSQPTPMPKEVKEASGRTPSGFNDFEDDIPW